MKNHIDFYKLKNGMVLIGERIDHVHSVSFRLLLPAGASLLPAGCCGASTVLSDWLFRGAGNYDSRGLIEALDGLGVHRDASAGVNHLSLSASLEASNLSTALSLFADIILSPQLQPKQFDLSKQLALSELQGLDDDPRQKVMILLAQAFYPDPFGRPAVGTVDELKSLTNVQVAEIAQKMIDPSRMIFSVCGQYDFDAICHQMETLFDIPDIEGLTLTDPVSKNSSNTHYQTEGSQVHIGLMTPVPAAVSQWQFEILTAVSILSGSMSSRLFTEVREKRGLCYAVGAKYKTLRDYAGIGCYAGTTPDKAQQTFDVIRSEFDRLKEGITEDELQRAKVGLKTSLIMQGESTSTRSATLASDYFLLGHARQLDEIRDKIESITTDNILDFLRKHPFEEYTVTTIGSKAVTI